MRTEIKAFRTALFSNSLNLSIFFSTPTTFFRLAKRGSTNLIVTNTDATVNTRTENAAKYQLIAGDAEYDGSIICAAASVKL